MTPQTLLAHFDSGEFWPADHEVAAGGDLAHGYGLALAVRELRERRGERVAGYKIGWTNRGNWDRMGVAGPMWGTLHDTTLTFCDGHAEVALGHAKLPRLEPEIVVGFERVPPAGASFDELSDCIAWIAPGFEIVQAHAPDWRYSPAQTIADSAVHARLIVGRRTPARYAAPNGESLAARLAGAAVRLSEGGVPKADGVGTNVLDGPLHALRRFLQDMPRVPGAAPLKAGDVVTTGTWTDAQPIAPGETWQADFDAPIGPLRVTLR
ncbi:MAG: fumarylacetoacetate hydrolase family protein [Burkholderiaceae bacterium]